MADSIVVLDGARLVEIGTHEAPIARRGQYVLSYGTHSGGVPRSIVATHKTVLREREGCATRELVIAPAGHVERMTHPHICRRSVHDGALALAPLERRTHPSSFR